MPDNVFCPNSKPSEVGRVFFMRVSKRDPGYVSGVGAEAPVLRAQRAIHEELKQLLLQLRETPSTSRPFIFACTHIPFSASFLASQAVVAPARDFSGLSFATSTLQLPSAFFHLRKDAYKASRPHLSHPSTTPTSPFTSISPSSKRLNHALPVLPLLTSLPLITSQFTNPHAPSLDTRAAAPPIFGLECPQLAPGPVSSNFLAEELTVPLISDGNAIESIRQTLSLYALAIDGRNFEALSKVFTADVRANYSDPIGVLNGVDSIISTLPAGLIVFASTQHLLGTQFIQMCDLTSAVSVTYFQASHFFAPYTGIGNTIGNDQVLIDRAQYQDVWARQRDGSWKITNRNLVRMGPATLDGGFPTNATART